MTLPPPDKARDQRYRSMSVVRMDPREAVTLGGTGLGEGEGEGDTEATVADGEDTGAKVSGLGDGVDCIALSNRFCELEEDCCPGCSACPAAAAAAVSLWPLPRWVPGGGAATRKLVGAGAPRGSVVPVLG